MAITRKKLAARPDPRGRAMALSASGKGKPAPKKPGEKPAAKPAAKAVVKPALKSSATAAKVPAAKGAKPAPVLNKGALAAKAMAAARAAAKAEAEAQRPRKLVPATANAIRPGASKQAPAKGKAPPRPPAEVRPLGVLPPEAMAKAKPAPAVPRMAPPPRPAPPPARLTAPVRGGLKGDDRLDDADRFFTGLLNRSPSVEAYKTLGRLGHATVLGLQNHPRESNQAFQQLLEESRRKRNPPDRLVFLLNRPELLAEIGRALSYNKANAGPGAPFPEELENLRLPPKWAAPQPGSLGRAGRGKGA